MATEGENVGTTPDEPTPAKGPMLVKPSLLSYSLRPEVSRLLHVKNLPPSVSAEKLYTLFGNFGAIRQLRKGNTTGTASEAIVVYEDIYDAKKACDELQGQQVGKSRFLLIEYFDAGKLEKQKERKRRRKEMEAEYQSQLKKDTAAKQ